MKLLRRLSIAAAVPLLLLVACSQKTTPQPIVEAGAPQVLDASSTDASSDAESLDSGLDAAPDATKFADGGLAILERFNGKRILHCGDSFVGGAGGLHRGLETRFRGSGARMSSDTQVSLFMHEVAQGDYLPKLITRSYPDVIVLTLGANDIFMPHPEYLIPHIEAIARKAAKDRRTCYWVAPPLWKSDDAGAAQASGVLKVLTEHAAPCKVFDVSNMRPDLTIPRRNDGIHPTDEGGELWAAAFWEYLAAEPTATATSTPTPTSTSTPTTASK